MSNDTLIEELSKKIEVELDYSNSERLVGKKRTRVNSVKLSNLAKKIRKDFEETNIDSMQPNPSS